MKPRTPLGGLGLVALLGAAVGLSACQGAGAFAQVNEQLSQISDKQAQILSRLDQLETKIANLPAAPAAGGKQAPQGPQPGKPDPAATYKVAVAPTDVSKGPADALVTLVEWSDFQ